MIALALRKRFAQMNQVNDSPERDREDRDRDREDSFSESTEDLFGSHITPKYATPRPAKIPSPRKLFVFTRPAAVSSSIDKGKENGQTPVHLTTKLKNSIS